MIFQSTLFITCVSHSCCWSCIWCVAHPRESSIFLSISNLSEIVSGTHLIYPHHQRTLWNMRDTHEQCHTLCISTKNLFLSNISKSFLDNIYTYVNLTLNNFFTHCHERFLFDDSCSLVPKIHFDVCYYWCNLLQHVHLCILKWWFSWSIPLLLIFVRKMKTCFLTPGCTIPG